MWYRMREQNFQDERLYVQRLTIRIGAVLRQRKTGKDDNRHTGPFYTSNK